MITGDLTIKFEHEAEIDLDGMSLDHIRNLTEEAAARARTKAPGPQGLSALESL